MLFSEIAYTRVQGGECRFRHLQCQLRHFILLSATVMLNPDGQLFVLYTRPVFHQLDQTIRGHVFCSFLALVPRKELERRLEKTEHRFEWADIKQDLRPSRNLPSKKITKTCSTNCQPRKLRQDIPDRRSCAAANDS